MIAVKLGKFCTAWKVNWVHIGYSTFERYYAASVKSRQSTSAHIMEVNNGIYLIPFF